MLERLDSPSPAADVPLSPRRAAGATLGHARELPSPASITALEAAALGAAADSARRAEIRALAVSAIAQLWQITGQLARLAEVLGDEPAGGDRGSG